MHRFVCFFLWRPINRFMYIILSYLKNKLQEYKLIMFILWHINIFRICDGVSNICHLSSCNHVTFIGYGIDTDMSVRMFQQIATPFYVKYLIQYDSYCWYIPLNTSHLVATYTSLDKLYVISYDFVWYNKLISG